MMSGLLCGIPAAMENALAVTRQGEPVRWVTLPWDLPGSNLIAVVSHITGPPVTCAALGLLAGLAAAVGGLVLVRDPGQRKLDRSYWDAGLLVFFLCAAPLWPRLWTSTRWLAGGAGTPVAHHGSWLSWGVPLAAAAGLFAAATVVHRISRRQSSADQSTAAGRWAAGTLIFSAALLGAGPLHGLLARAGMSLVPLLVSLGLLFATPLLLFLLFTAHRFGAAGRFLAGLGLRVVAARIPRRFQCAGLLLLAAVPVALLLCLAAAAVGAARDRDAAAAGVEAGQRPNLVLIYIDTLRRDHLSCYGRELVTSPVIDRLAAGAVQFSSATSPASHTVPAVCSVMTCRYPHPGGLSRGQPFQLSADCPTLAVLLRASGYRTAAFIGNYVLGRDYDTRIWQGFDVFDDRFPQRESGRRIPEREAGALGRAAVSWLRANRDQRFFLWLHFQDPHGPYTPPDGAVALRTLDHYGPSRTVPLAGDNFSRGGIPAYQRLGGANDPRLYLAGYDGEIAHTDRNVGLVLAWLRRLGLDHNTVVVLLSDHGEAMEDDHGYYFSHGHDLTEDQVRVPLLIGVPGAGKGRVVNREVSTLDLFPTLLHLAGVDIPQGLPGRDLLAMPDARSTDGVVLTFTGGGIRAARSGPYKLIQRGGKAFLYNTDLDPGETTDLSELERGQALWMAREMNDALADQKPGAAGSAEGWSEEVRRRLRLLGYVD